MFLASFLCSVITLFCALITLFCALIILTFAIAPVDSPHILIIVVCVDSGRCAEIRIRRSIFSKISVDDELAFEESSVGLVGIESGFVEGSSWSSSAVSGRMVLELIAAGGGIIISSGMESPGQNASITQIKWRHAIFPKFESV